MRKLFSTDGIRGIANVHPMTPEIALKVGKAVALYFKEKNNFQQHKIVIGKDTRLSGYMIESALTSGIVSAGVNVLLVGPMPTPGVAHLTRSLKCDAGIVLSASHNPAEDNGIKIFSSEGFKLSDDVELEIEKIIFSKEKLNLEHVRGNAIGKAFRVEDAKGRYIEFVKSTIGNNSLHGLKIVLDCANGAAYKIAPIVFSELGAEVVVLHNKPNGLNINKGCGAMHPQIIQETVITENADIGIAFDGDADRVLVCDENGRLVNGDKLIAINALHLKKKNKLHDNTVVVSEMVNSGFEKSMKAAGIKLVKTKVGDRYIIEKVKEGNYSLGGEPNGHMVFFEHSTTDDGIVSALQLLNVMKESGKKISELANCCDLFPQTLLNVKVRDKRDLNELKNVQKAIKEVKEKLGNEGKVLIRYSGTENVCRILVEGKNEKEIKEFAEKIADEVKKEVGAE